MRIFLIGAKTDIYKLIGKSPVVASFEGVGVVAVVVEKSSIKKDAEGAQGVNIVSENKFVRFVETNNLTKKDAGEKVQAE